MLQFLGWARNTQPCPTAVSKEKSLLWTPAGDWKVYLHCNCGTVFQKHCRFPMLRGNLTRTRGKLHSLSHSTDHMSLDVVDHVPSTIPESSFPAIFLVNEAVIIRMIIQGRSPNLRHVSRTHRVDLYWPIWTVLCPFDMCVPQNKWQTFLGKVHPPQFSGHPCCSCSTFSDHQN